MINFQAHPVDSPTRTSIRRQPMVAQTPKEHFMSSLNLITVPEANRLTKLKPLKKDIVAVLKDRKTIKSYITTPWVSLIKADSIHKYVLAKGIMKPQAFNVVRPPPNPGKKTKKRRFRLVMTKKRKVFKPSTEASVAEVRMSMKVEVRSLHQPILFLHTNSYITFQSVSSLVRVDGHCFRR